MEAAAFRTPAGTPVTAVTGEEMRAVDRVAVEEVGVALLQMMENAGRTLAAHARERRGDGRVVVFAGAGGNGGGGLACARHLDNRGVPVAVVLDRAPDELSGAPGTQLGILEATGVTVTADVGPIADAGLLVDALIGYGLDAAPRGRAAELIGAIEDASTATLSLDVPSGVNATTGERPGVAVRPDRTLTLALPKTGLTDLAGGLYLADIAVPPAVYGRLDIPYTVPFPANDWVRVTTR